MTFVLPSIGSGIIASPTSAPPAAFNTYSVDLDGTNDYVNAVSPSALSNVEAISVWFKPDSAITSIGLKGYLLGLGGSDIGIALGGDWFGPVTNEVISVVNVNHVWSYTGSGVTVSSGTWHHLGVRWESSSSSTNSGVAGYDIYLDGVKVGNGFGTYSSGGGAKITTSAITAGARNRNGTIEAFYNGLIDELGIFTSAVSESDLLAMYNSGVPADLSSYSPALWWRMGDNDGGTGTTITDQGSGGNDGTLTNGPTFSTDVPTAPPAWNGNTYSVSFDGSDDYVDCGTVSALNSASTFSVSAWYKKSSAGAGGLIVGGKPYPSREFYIEHYSDNNIYVGYDSSFASVSSTSDTNWHHVVYVRDSGTHKLYLDGSDMSLGGTPSSTTGASAGQNFSIGNLRYYSGYFGGVIDEVAVFSSALSASNVTAIYNSGVPADLSSYSPVHWWRMGDNDGGTGTTITDQGSGGNDGTLTNGPTFSTDVPTAPPAFSTYSIDLDGITDYVSITPSSSIDLYGVSFWINCDFTIDKNTTRGVLLAPGGTNWFLGLGGNFTGTLTDEIISINTGARYGYCSSTDTISTGWHNIIAAWSTSSATTGGDGYDIYLDGVKVGNQSNTTYGAATLFSIPTSEIRFGERFGAFPYPGLMDEVAIFDSTLSASDISTIYNSGTPSNISSLSPAGWWRMGENDGATGTTITDQGSGGNDATLVNGPTFSTDTP